MGAKKYVIIVAGGSGSRMQSQIPKQFLSIGDKTILEHTITKFLQNDAQLKVTVVIPKAHEYLWKKLPKLERVQVTFGGATRYQSVANGLKTINAMPNDLVAIHDAVRPLISNDLIDKCFAAAQEKGNAIPATEVVDTLRVFDKEKYNWVDRAKYRAIQTPQTFQYKLIEEAYSQPYSKNLTDDASVVEQLGAVINLIAGERNNIKITTKEDLKLARALSDL